MWDGRESTPPLTEKITFATNPNDLLFDFVNFYDVRFNIELTAQEKSDFVAFLNAL
jgi:hypothetical protein